jgi:hypothetical protein
MEPRGASDIDGQTERSIWAGAHESKRGQQMSFKRSGPGDAMLIPPGAWHTITATEPLRFLCCCAPPYAHEDTYFE